MRKHLPLILVALFLAGVQIACTYWFTRHDAVANRLDRIHVDIANGGIFYATYDSGTFAMTPRAALQTQAELSRTIALMQRQAQQMQVR